MLLVVGWLVGGHHQGLRREMIGGTAYLKVRLNPSVGSLDVPGVEPRRRLQR